MVDALPSSPGKASPSSEISPALVSPHSPVSFRTTRSASQPTSPFVKARLSLQRQPPSRFIEDLPEWKPYHLLSPTHRRKVRSPTRSFTSSKHSQKGSIASRQRCCGLAELVRPRLSNDGRKTRPRAKIRKRRKDKPVLVAQAQLSRAGASDPSRAAASVGEKQKEHISIEQISSRRDYALRNQTTDPAPKRKPSKLKKRPPRSSPSLRGSTYSEWRGSMILTVSADVSRKSSKRTVSSRRSLLSIRYSLRSKPSTQPLIHVTREKQDNSRKMSARAKIISMLRRMYRCSPSTSVPCVENE